MWPRFVRKKAAYHQIIGDQEFSEKESDNGEGPSQSILARDEHYYTSQKSRHQRRSLCNSGCCNIFIAIISLSLGLIAGQFLRAEYTIDGYIAPYANPARNIKHVTWSMNETFTSPPSKANDAAWSSLMPLGRGFISHPVLTSGTTKAVSMFHELHCLHGLRTAYYAQTNKFDKLKHSINPSHAYTPNAYLDGLSEHELGLFHVVHCFEYIRQALICAADTNLDTVRKRPNGEVGTEPWEGERVCRDWEGIKEWAEKWHVGDGDGIVGK